MLFDHRKMLQTPQEAAKLEGALDEYLALEGGAPLRARFERRGPERRAMLEAVAQMAMLFAAAHMGSQEEFEACLADALDACALDLAPRRALRGFYLRNVSRVPGTPGEAMARLLLARAPIMAGPLAGPAAAA